jgi:hypothetical protein
MKQIDLGTKVVNAYTANENKRSINPYPGFSFIILAKTKKANHELLPSKGQSNPGPP